MADTRQQEYVGTIRKCPNCGAVVEAFQTRCSLCGFELNNIKSNNAVEEFFRKLENFDAEQAETDKEEYEQKVSDDISVKDMAKDYLKKLARKCLILKKCEKQVKKVPMVCIMFRNLQKRKQYI